MKIFVFLIASALFATSAFQTDRAVLSQDETAIEKAGTNGIFDSAGLNRSGLPCRFEASYDLEEGSNKGAVRITVSPDPGFHVFSITQPDKGPTRTTIAFSSPNVRIVGNFEADSNPELSLNEAGFEGKRVEMHSEPVTWTASIELDAANTKEPAGIDLTINGQLCTTGQCIGIRNYQVEAQFIGYYTSAIDDDRNGPFREPDSLSEWTIQLSKNKAKAGETVELIVRGKPDDTYHLYMYDPSDEASEWRTLIYLKQKGGLKAGRPIANKSCKHKDFGTGEEVGYYEGEVEWKIPLRIPMDAIPNSYPIVGSVGYQTCSESSCDQPRGIEFRTEIEITDGITNSSPIMASMQAVAFKSIAELPKRNRWIDESRLAKTISLKDLLSKLGLAMLGGLILNVMPCVLPVIGLKILGFVSEAAGDRKSASRLTLVYALGIVSLILALGILSITVRGITGQAYGWGEQFGSVVFRIASTSFMFALALSFLGIWDIPIPGFATGGKSAELASREGYLGAYFKGIITTILATPCSAPFLGGVFVVALSQPSWVVLIIFTGVGLGMALPYLLLAAQPALLSFVPKPGPWMETFKEFLAFPMLLSVVMFVNGFTGDQKMAMLAALIFVWFACWMVGRVAPWSETAVKLRTWGLATAIALIGTWGAFYFMQPSPYRLAWKSYNEESLDRLVGEGHTVLIDFTAEWCQNCKLNLNRAIQTRKVKDWVEKHNVVAMEADLTEYPTHIKDKLNELESISIPVLAIYRPGDSETPIVLRDIVSENDVLKALEQAGPSRLKTDGTTPKPTSVGTRPTVSVD
jgi:thiol:disulfide interchange protein